MKIYNMLAFLSIFNLSEFTFHRDFKLDNRSMFNYCKSLKFSMESDRANYKSKRKFKSE